MTEIILVHGMNADADSWGEVPRLLADAVKGNVTSVPLPGHDKQIDTSNLLKLFALLLISGGKYVSGLSMADYVSSVVERFPGGTDRDVVLVGHSMGGAVISEVARQYPERISKLVYVAAMLPNEGQSPASIIQWIKASGFSSPQQTWEDFEPHFGQMKLVYQPEEPLTSEFSRTAEFEALPKLYIRCSEDDVIPVELQDAMVQAYTDVVLEPLESSHFPQFALPEKLSGVIAKFLKS
ncbi:MAG: alpha/beta hydrolase [Pseudomonadota bacterium]